MPKSPPYEIPAGVEGKSLAGVSTCGCLSAALAVHTDDSRYSTTKKDVRDFYADMATTGRRVEWLTNDEIRRRLFEDCDVCRRDTCARCEGDGNLDDGICGDCGGSGWAK